MKHTNAITNSCCIKPDQQCKGNECMAWLCRKDSAEEGQCTWMVTANMIVNAAAVLASPLMRGRIVG